MESALTQLSHNPRAAGPTDEKIKQRAKHMQEEDH
jgi:hypothetical protein